MAGDWKALAQCKALSDEVNKEDYRPIKKGYLFCWNKVPGSDEVLLKYFMKNIISADWIDSARINKSKDGNTICISLKMNRAVIRLAHDKSKATLSFNNEMSQDLAVELDNGLIYIYRKKEVRKKERRMFQVQYQNEDTVFERKIIKRIHPKSNHKQSRNNHIVCFYCRGGILHIKGSDYFCNTCGHIYPKSKILGLLNSEKDK